MKRASLIAGLLILFVFSSVILAQPVGPYVLPADLFGTLSQGFGSYFRVIKERLEVPSGPAVTNKELAELSGRMNYFLKLLTDMSQKTGALAEPKDLDSLGRLTLVTALACDECGEMKAEGRLKELPSDLGQLRALLIERCALLDRLILQIQKRGGPIQRPDLSKISSYLYFMQTITLWYGRLDAGKS
jgi:hypothetical protein